MAWFLFVFLLGVLVFIPIYFIITKNKKANLETEQDQTANVKVVSKIFEIVPDFINSIGTHSVYYATFQFDDGECINFQLSEQRFDLIMENETGLLTYRENNGQIFFVNFVPTN